MPTAKRSLLRREAHTAVTATYAKDQKCPGRHVESPHRDGCVCVFSYPAVPSAALARSQGGSFLLLVRMTYDFRAHHNFSRPAPPI